MLQVNCNQEEQERGDGMDGKRITLLLPQDVIDIAESKAAQHKMSRHNYLVSLISSTLGGEVMDTNADKIKEIADLQRVNISILARMWGEQNKNAAQIIRDMIDRERGK